MLVGPCQASPSRLEIYDGVMEYRQLGRTDMQVSAISFGAWAVGGSWGQVDDEESMRALHAAVDEGVNFIDTADVYGDGQRAAGRAAET